MAKKNKKVVRQDLKPRKPSNAVLNGVLAGLIPVVVFLFIGEYFLLIPINIQCAGLWWELIFITVVFAAGFHTAVSLTRAHNKRLWELQYISEKPKKNESAEKIIGRVAIGIPAVLFILLLLLSFFGSKLLNAKIYAAVLTVTEADFQTDLAETLDTDAIALMDTASAQKLGDREIGSLSEVVSQYNVSSDYIQIDLDGSPVKVSALDYAGFFKWTANRANGVPGYVTVDPVSMSADYVELSEGMIYVPSAYFGEDADRYIFTHYPTKITGAAHFEIDEDGNPYYVAPVYEHTIGLFGGTTVTGIILLDPVTGELTEYALSNVPTWVDYVFDGDLLCEQYNWFGELSNGFWNSIFAKKGCKTITTYSSDDYLEEESDDSVPTNDYGYIAKDGDIWIYTGVTSVNNDSSNIGFLLADQRTGEARYYTVSGADERSAMDAAEGEVQEKGYQASFPSLINVDGNPTYIMVLKDASGLVKLYAAVNVEQYNYVTTASTQEECIEKYKTLLGIGGDDADSNDDGSADDSDSTGAGSNSDDSSGADSSGEDAEKVAVGETDLTLAAVRYVTVEGNTWIYLVAEDGTVYRALAPENESMMILEAGDAVHISYTEDREIVSCEMVTE
ncbi:MAG: hypothetical protein LUE29_12115 [Lachnospiraceae bacterium]|nr:hypothetical protein [Lachnospiraceae bacterium]